MRFLCGAACSELHAQQCLMLPAGSHIRIKVLQYTSSGSHSTSSISKPHHPQATRVQRALPALYPGYVIQLPST